MDIDSLFRTFNAALSCLKSDESGLWKEVQGEMQADYNEAIFWILLYDDTDIKLAHAKLVEVLMPFLDGLKPLELAIFYSGLTRTETISEARLVGTQAVLDAVGSDDLVRRDHTEPRDPEGVFESVDSIRP